MEIFTAGIDLLKNIVTLIGGGMLVIGIITLLMAQSDSNAGQKNIGISLMIAGLGVGMVGQTLVPMLASGI